MPGAHLPGRPGHAPVSDLSRGENSLPTTLISVLPELQPPYGMELAYSPVERPDCLDSSSCDVFCDLEQVPDLVRGVKIIVLTWGGGRGES